MRRRMPDKWRMVHPGAAAYGHVLKSTSPKRFPSAFVAKMSSGHTGIFERTGGMTSGGKAHARRLAQKAIEKQPLVKTLIVSGDCLPEARLKVKTPGNALYANYRKIAGK